MSNAINSPPVPSLFLKIHKEGCNAQAGEDSAEKDLAHAAPDGFSSALAGAFAFALALWAFSFAAAGLLHPVSGNHVKDSGDGHADTGTNGYCLCDILKLHIPVLSPGKPAPAVCYVSQRKHFPHFSEHFQYTPFKTAFPQILFF